MLPILLTAVSRSFYGTDLNRVRVSEILLNPGVILLLIYVALLFALSLLGLVLFLFGIRELDLREGGIRVKHALSSCGIVVFLAAAGTMCVVG